MRIEFEADTKFVQFPTFKDDSGKIDMIKVPRTMMPLKEIHGEKILTMGHCPEQHLLAFQLKQKPNRICYAYPCSPEMFQAFIHDLNKEIEEDELLDFIMTRFLVVEEGCTVYPDDHLPVEDIKYKKE